MQSYTLGKIGSCVTTSIYQAFIRYGVSHRFTIDLL